MCLQNRQSTLFTIIYIANYLIKTPAIAKLSSKTTKFSLKCRLQRFDQIVVDFGHHTEPGFEGGAGLIQQHA